MPAMSEVGSVPADIAGEEVAAGRAALARHAWQEAYDHFRSADGARPLSGPELEGLAESAFFVARADDEAEAKERAFKVYEAAGDTQRAAYIALSLTRNYGYQGKRAIAAVWLRRAERLIGPSGDTYVDGYLALVRSEGARAMGDIDRALEQAEQAIAISQRAEDADLRAHALSNLGELEDRHRRDLGWHGAHGRGHGVGRERRADAVHHRDHRVSDHRGVPEPDGLPARHGVDRGDRALLRTTVALGVPGHLQDPSGRGRRRRWRLGTGGTGARASDA